MNRFFRPQFWSDIQGKRTWKSHLQTLIVLAVLAISLGVAILGSQDQLTQILMLIVGVGGLVILLKYPAIGLIGVLVGSFFVSFTGPGGVNIAILGVAGVAGLWFLQMLIAERRIYFIEPRTTKAIFVFIGGAVVSFIVGQFPWQPLATHAPITAQVGGMLIFILSGLAFLVMGNVIRNLGWLQFFTWLFVAIGALYIVARMAPPVANVMRHYFQSGALTGSLFWVWILVIPFSQALLNKSLHVVWRVALFALVVAVLYVAIGQASDWKSGFIPPLAGMAVVVTLRLGKRAFWMIPPLAIAAYYVLNQAIVSDQYSTLTRIEAWKIVIQITNVSPIFGLGFGNYYWYTPLIPILGWQVNFNSHSQYVDIYSQTGLIGLILFAWVFWEIARLGWSLINRTPEGFARAYVYGALGGLVGTLVAGLFVDWILPFVYNIGMNGFRASVFSWLFLGGLGTIHQLVEKQPAIEITE